MRILLIRPQFGGFLVIPRDLEPSPTVVPHDVAYDGGRFLLRGQCGTLEFVKRLSFSFFSGHLYLDISVFVGGGTCYLRV